MLELVRAHGGRVTSARRAVLSALVSADAHLTAEEVAQAVHSDHPDVHLSTVYRTLEALEQLGVVTHVHLGHGKASYHLAERVHHHAACEVCGHVIELPADLLSDVVRELKERHGFVADVHHFAFVGHCTTCLPEGHIR